MNQPKVSVCMITYNHEKFISEAIEGVLMQECDFEVEFLVADDSSTDGTQEIVQNYIDGHVNGHWIRYVKHPENRGMMNNFVWALEQCQGELIALCEGDDYWNDPQKLCRQVYFLEENFEFVLSFHDCQIVDISGALIAPSRLNINSKRDLSSRSIRYGTLVPTASILFRSNALPSYFPDPLLKVYNGDMVLLFYLSLKGKAHFHDDFIGSSYRLHSGGIWSLLEESEKVKRSLFSYELLRNSLNLKNRKLLDEILCLVYYEYGKKYRESSNSYFLKSIRSSFFSLNFKICLFSIIKVLKLN